VGLTAIKAGSYNFKSSRLATCIFIFYSIGCTKHHSPCVGR